MFENNKDEKKNYACGSKPKKGFEPTQKQDCRRIYFKYQQMNKNGQNMYINVNNLFLTTHFQRNEQYKECIECVYKC